MGLVDILVAYHLNCLSRAKQTNERTKHKRTISFMQYNSLFLYHGLSRNVLGVTFDYKPKDGQCQAICCDGAGGELTVERVCTPAEKCEGIEPDEKEEDEHCPGESKGDCPDTCEDEGAFYRFV